MRNKNIPAFTATCLVLAAAPTVHAVVLVDYDDGIANGIHEASVRNGGFEDVTVTGVFNSYNVTPNWFNIGSGDQTQELVRDNLTRNTAQNAVIAESANRISALDTGHTLATGQMINFSYFWRDAFNWDDASDQVGFTIYTTGDNMIDGSLDQSLTSLSGISTANDSYQEHSGSLVATAAMDGKNLFISIDSVDGNANANGFARLDDVFVEAIPEPATTALIGIGGLALLLRRRK